MQEIEEKSKSKISDLEQEYEQKCLQLNSQSEEKLKSIGKLIENAQAEKKRLVAVNYGDEINQSQVI